MKYIKTFERRYTSMGQTKDSLSKKTVDYNKIYTIDCDGEISNVGKISNNPGKGIRDVGCVMNGINIKTGESIRDIVRFGTWRWVRESTPEEIERYKIFNQSNKFNL